MTILQPPHLLVFAMDSVLRTTCYMRELSRATTRFTLHATRSTQHASRNTSLLTWLLLTFFLWLPATQAQQEPPPLVASIGTVGMTVSDMDRSVEFYTTVLSFEKTFDTEVWGSEYEHLQGIFGLRMRVVRLQLGNELIELTEYLTPKGRPFLPDSRGNDHWFQHVALIVSDMEKAYDWLRQHKVQHASTGPQRLPDWNPNAGGIKAFYFRDPDGHFLEILWFPPGKGDPKWHRATDRLFLGIDHTAIVVSDTEASLKLYHDILGMKIIGESENYGDEQEHLNNVFGARLRITSMRAASGPGIEFLEYLAPHDGRPMPTDEHANDLVHWQTRLITHEAENAWRQIRAGAYPLISSGVVAFGEPRLGFQKAIIVRDPDGHAMQIIEGLNH